jgi:diguanylate cyclase (GGDEF)-like protein
MTDKPIHTLKDCLLEDPLSAAALTPQQRRAWEDMVSEVLISREKIATLEERVRILERKSPSDDFIQSILTKPEFNREVARMLAFDERYGGQSSVLYYDIENLSEITATGGRPTTDKVLRCLCDTMAKNIRRSDILGRLAPDEFGILLVRCDNAFAWKKGELLAGLLCKAFSEIAELKIQPVISYGAYTFREKEDVSTGLQRAGDIMTKISNFL